MKNLYKNKHLITKLGLILNIKYSYIKLIGNFYVYDDVRFYSLNQPQSEMLYNIKYKLHSSYKKTQKIKLNFYDKFKQKFKNLIKRIC